MPKKKYDDKVLKPKALELRKRGYSYREIAKELGCSVYKVHELLAPIESSKSRLTQIAELTSKVDELFKKVGGLEAKLSKYGGFESIVNEWVGFKDDVAEVKRGLTEVKAELSMKYEELSKKFKNLSTELTKYEGMLSELSKVREEVVSVRKELTIKYDELKAKYDEVKKSIDEIVKKLEEETEKLKKAVPNLTKAADLVDLIVKIANVKTKELPCTYIDSEGYCTQLSLSTERLKDLSLKSLSVEDLKPDFYWGKVVYRLNVLKHPLICAICPKYMPKQPQSSTFKT